MSQSCKVKPDHWGDIRADVLIFYVHVKLVTLNLENIVRLKRQSLLKLG